MACCCGSFLDILNVLQVKWGWFGGLRWDEVPGRGCWKEELSNDALNVIERVQRATCITKPSIATLSDDIDSSDSSSRSDVSRKHVTRDVTAKKEERGICLCSSHLGIRKKRH